MQFTTYFILFSYTIKYFVCLFVCLSVCCLFPRPGRNIWSWWMKLGTIVHCDQGKVFFIQVGHSVTPYRPLLTLYRPLIGLKFYFRIWACGLCTVDLRVQRMSHLDKNLPLVPMYNRAKFHPPTPNITAWVREQTNKQTNIQTNKQTKYFIVQILRFVPRQQFNVI